MRPLFGLVPLALAASFALPAFAHDAPQAGTISIEGRGEVQAAPDTAFITSGVTSQGENAKAALDANTAAMSELIATLKAAGIDAKDIQTSAFSVSPNYVYSDQRDANGFNIPPKINGYIVSNNVTVRVRDLPSLGGVLDKAVSVGANTINGVNFTVADPSKLYDEARKAAFADAKTKAGLYAVAADVTLDNIVSISESQGGVQPEAFMMKAMVPPAGAARDVPVEAGELTYAINVSVQWSLDQAGK